ncbi:NAD(P)-binding protein [Pseudovirgaria hyperparasitica]|uniref:NAD(P)-binding protein n=1 Tax=Pseudovirgaria hyperparasitica TaxID=470096 RepID=A0A6A6W9H1_9PEZI|nr:NAD(P)-binding protein [Pseudovirgaria hyperparasitica]KAF2758674.1 NAD(P)-binding protein [Pseudovirgaria hyperparasitica]
MSSVLLFGGSGKVARHLTKQLASSGYTVYSVIRNPEQVDELKGLGASPILQSIEDSSQADFVDLIKKHKPTAVVWAAGAGGGNPERTQSVDYRGAVKTMDAIAQAADEAGTTRRYVTVSALDVRDRESKPVPSWYDDNDKSMSDRVWGVIKAYMLAKYEADKSLVEENGRRKLDYTIVRPGGLSQDPAVGVIAAGHVKLGRTISREDVAAVVAECLKNEKTVGLAFDVAGGDTKISEAVAKIASDRVDTFEGFH